MGSKCGRSSRATPSHRRGRWVSPSSMSQPISSRAGVCDVAFVRGAAADPQQPPDLVLEVPHGATRSAHFTALRARLRGTYAADLHDFFCVNTDVGAPELANAIAKRVHGGAAATDRRRGAMPAAAHVRRLQPPHRSRRRSPARRSAGETDAGPAAVGRGSRRPRTAARGLLRLPRRRDRRVRRRMRQRRFRDVRAHLRAAQRRRRRSTRTSSRVFAPPTLAERIGTWQLRPSVDLITHDPEGRELASPELASRSAEAFAAAGFDVAQERRLLAAPGDARARVRDEPRWPHVVLRGAARPAGAGVHAVPRDGAGSREGRTGRRAAGPRAARDAPLTRTGASRGPMRQNRAASEAARRPRSCAQRPPAGASSSPPPRRGRTSPGTLQPPPDSPCPAVVGDRVWPGQRRRTRDDRPRRHRGPAQAVCERLGRRDRVRRRGAAAAARRTFGLHRLALEDVRQPAPARQGRGLRRTRVRAVAHGRPGKTQETEQFAMFVGPTSC
jgi:hypothetical protein